MIPLKKPEMQGAKFSRNEKGESRFALLQRTPHGLED